MAEYFKKLDEAGAGTNVIHLLPHGALRAEVMGSVRRPPSEDELEKMRQLAEKAMRDGAWGMSTGLIYVPGTYAETDEIVEIAKVVGPPRRHLRQPHSQRRDGPARRRARGDRDRPPRPACRCTSRTSRPPAATPGAACAWRRPLIEEARQKGQRVTADQYPYIASSTSLEAMVIPTWAREGGSKRLIARLDDQEPGPSCARRSRRSSRPAIRW